MVKSVYVRRPELYESALKKLKEDNSSMSEFFDMCLEVYVENKLMTGCVKCQQIKPKLEEIVETLNRLF